MMTLKKIDKELMKFSALIKENSCLDARIDKLPIEQNDLINLKRIAKQNKINLMVQVDSLLDERIELMKGCKNGFTTIMDGLSK